MLSLNDWLLFAGAALLISLTPGPNMIYLISRSICQGRRAVPAGPDPDRAEFQRQPRHRGVGGAARGPVSAPPALALRLVAEQRRAA